MDLPYPSQKDQQLNVQLSSIRKPSLILRDSAGDLPPPPLSPSLKRQVSALLKQDLAYELRDLMDRQVISMTAQVGRDGSAENILHQSCRYNAVQCVQFLMKTYYIYFPSQFEWWTNIQTKDKMTAIMLCALTGSNDCLMLILEVGGADIHTIDNNKQTAYNIALNSKNMVGVSLLMNHQAKSKRNQCVNREILAQEIQLVPGRVSFCDSMYRCLLGCFMDEGEKKMVKERKRTPSFLENVGAEIQGYFIDKVDLGLSKIILSEMEVQWKMMGEYQEKGLTGILFDTFSPFDMEDITNPNENMLMVLQSLSQHPWLVRRIVQADKAKTKNRQYSITLHPQHCPTMVTTDGYLPIMSNGQAAFLANKKEGWPMIVQKALAKHHGSYKALQLLGAKQMMESLTGWPVQKLQITQTQNPLQLMQRINSQGYMYILEGKPNSLLSCPAKPNCCFTALTFYTKGTSRMVLINCPFVDPDWVQKEKSQILALKILRGHYNCRQQMTIWVEEDRLKDYFSSILVAPIKSGFNRHSLVYSADSWVYFRVELPQKHEESPIFYLIDTKTSKMVSLKGIQGWARQSQKINFVQAEFLQDDMTSFEGKRGDYLLRVKVPKGSYMLVGWATEQMKMQSVQECFGGIEWVGSLKKNVIQEWNQVEKSKIVSTGDYTLFVSRSQGGWVEDTKSEVIEGKREKAGQVKMVGLDDYCYCILKGENTDATISDA